MKTKLCKPILIDINDKIHSGNNRLFIDKYGKLFINNSFSFNDIIELQLTRQQLILISLDPDDKIEEGDLFYDTYSKFLNKASVNFGRTGNDFAKKVIATQDQLSPVFIKHFVEEYNKGKVKDVEIEMEESYDDETIAATSGFSLKVPINIKYSPKLTKGLVHINPIKDNLPYNGWTNLSEDDLNTINPKKNTKEETYYTEKEVWDITYKAVSFYLDWVKGAMKDSSIDKPDLLEWFNEHKKK